MRSQRWLVPVFASLFLLAAVLPASAQMSDSLRAKASDGVAIVLMVKGKVDAKQGNGPWNTLAFGSVVHNGEQVRTGVDGFAALAFTDDGSQVKMRPSSMATINADRQPDNSLLKRVVMNAGDLLSDVRKQKGTMQIATPTSVASVKGTSFWVLVGRDGETTLITLEGLVGLQNTLSNQEVDVGAGQYAVSQTDGTINVAELGPEVTVPEFPEIQQEGQPQGQMEQGEGQAPEGEGAQPEGEAAPEGGPAGEEQPAEEPHPSGGGIGFGMNGAVGAATIDGKMYQSFSLRPDISIGKFGIGLDLTFYFDADGNLRKEDWNQPGDAIDKIFYLRYAKPGDPFYARVGALENVTLGYGLIMRRYSNAIEWPQVRRIGLHTQVHKGNFGFEAIVNNFREIETPGVVGARVTYETHFMLPVVIGATGVMDGNEYLGAKDTDGDGVPNQFDQFPGIDDKEHIQWLRSILSQQQIDDLILSGDIPDINNPAPSVADLKSEVSVWGVDIGVPIIRKKAMSLWVYAQMAQIVGYGRGYSMPGVSFKMGPFHAGAEYRVFEKEFMPDFFNLSYEVERVVWDEDSSGYVTKKMRLAGFPKAQGYYIDAGVDIMNMVNIYGAYQSMAYGDATIPGKSLYAKGSINTDPIPKLGLAEAYYQQPQADNVFRTKADGTTIGYRLGFDMAQGMMLVYDNKTIYRNGAPNHIMTIETVIKF